MAVAPTRLQREHWDKIAQLGCIVCGSELVQFHHALTGAGGRKNHDKVLPLCYHHHQGAQGIHALGRKKWQSIYGTELELLDRVDKMLVL